jgi:hypothetical protein
VCHFVCPTQPHASPDQSSIEKDAIATRPTDSNERLPLKIRPRQEIARRQRVVPPACENEGVLNQRLEGQLRIGCAEQVDAELDLASRHALQAGLSQTLTQVAERAGSAPFLCFVNLRKSEAAREQPVLFADAPWADEAEALAQPQHGLKALNGASGCREGLEAPNPGHGSFDPKVVALDALLQVRRCLVT